MPLIGNAQKPSACGGGGSSTDDGSAAGSAAAPDAAAASATSLEDFGSMADLEAAAKAEGALNVIALPHNWANYTSKMVRLLVVGTPNPFLDKGAGQ